LKSSENGTQPLASVSSNILIFILNPKIWALVGGSFKGARD
jgi:hypothetical protein